MSDAPASSNDAFLLTLDECAILGLGALLGLQARPVDDVGAALVADFLSGDLPLRSRSRPLLVTPLPGVRSQ